MNIEKLIETLENWERTGQIMTSNGRQQDDLLTLIGQLKKQAKNCSIPDVSGSLPLTEEKKLELILRKYHGHTKEQWLNELVKEYPYCEIPYLVEMVWKAAQGNDR